MRTGSQPVLPRHELFRRMRGKLTAAYWERADLERVAADAGLDLGAIDLSGTAVNGWRDILNEAERKNRVLKILDIIIEEVPSQKPTLEQLRTDYSRWVDAGRPTNESEPPVPVEARTPDEVSTSAGPKPPCPYPGMRPFREDESHLFFGREKETAYMVQQLRVHRFLAVIGASGSGKTSLVCAGLVPALRQSSLFGFGAWLVRDMRPGQSPFARLAQALDAEPDLKDFSKFDVQALLTTAPGTKRLLLVVDAFEELFTPEADVISAFQQALLGLAGRPDCYVVLVVRADFYPNLMAGQFWQEIRTHRMEVPPLDEAGLRQAIKEPARRIGVLIEARLVDQLVAEAAGEPGVLPFLQETLVQLWDQVTENRLSHSAYETLSEAPSYIFPDTKATGLQVAMAVRAESALGELKSLQEQEIARRIFLELVQFGEGRPDIRRQARVADLRAASDDPDLFDSTLDCLERQHLITLSGSEEESGAERPWAHRKADSDSQLRMTTGSRPGRIDLAHEALITGWPTLRNWIAEGKAAEVTRRKVVQAAREWAQHNRHSSYLYRGFQLEEALNWAAANKSGMAPEVRAFLTAAKRRAMLIRLVQMTALAMLLVLATFTVTRWVREYSWRRDAQGPMHWYAAGSATLGQGTVVSRLGDGISVDLPAFSVDQYEVTYRQYALCVRAGRCPPPYEIDMDQLLAPEHARLPVTSVNASQAAQFCDWIGRRLPFAVEWERAVRGTDGRLWPWGNTAPVPGEVQLQVGDYDPEGPVEVDQMPEAATRDEARVYHLVGNVWEWVILAPVNCAETDCRAPWRGEKDRTAVIGGAFDSTPDKALEPTGWEPHLADLSAGFRCAADG